MLCIPHGLDLDDIIQWYIIRTVSMIVLFMAIMAITFMYSVQRIVDDIHFDSGKRPTNYWIVLWTICPVILLVRLIFV